MQIHRIHGRDLREALERAGRLHGTDAIVLGHEQVQGGVTVAVTDRRPERAALAPRGTARSVPQITAPASARAPAPASPGGSTDLLAPAARLMRSGRAATRREPGLADVERALARTGASRGLIERVLEQVARGSHRGAFALDRAAALLGAAVPIAPSPKVSRRGGGPCAVALVGERGSGVTTTVTKLAGKLVKSGRRVALIDLRAPGDDGDGGRGGPTARGLEADARVLQVPLDEVREAEELARLLARSRAFDAVLIDGTGVAGRDVALLRELRARAPGLRLEVYLTLPATAYRGELDALAADHAAAGCTGLCLTRLDATRTPAPALEHALDTGRPLALFCDGADVSGHLRRPSPDRIADLFLRGRMA